MFSLFVISVILFVFSNATLANWVGYNTLTLIQTANDRYNHELEETFVAAKPDAVRRKLVGEIIARLEKKDLKLKGIKLIKPTKEQTTEHYEEHKDRYFFADLLGFFTEGEIVAMVWEGPNAVEIVRKLVGNTQPEDAIAGTIRGDYCLFKGRNLVHCSDSIANAKREISIWFEE